MKRYEFLHDLDTKEFWVYKGERMIVYGHYLPSGVSYKILDKFLLEDSELRSELIKFVSIFTQR